MLIMEGRAVASIPAPITTKSNVSIAVRIENYDRLRAKVARTGIRWWWWIEWYIQ